MRISIFTKWPHGYFDFFKDTIIGYFEYPWKLSILNIHEVTSWVFWMFESWRHGNIKKLTSWVLWIFMKWPYGYFEYSWGDVIGILKFIFKLTRLLLNIQNTHDITSRIFKIPMSLWIFKISMSHIQNYTFEYSKYPWHHFKNIPKYPWRQLLNISMTSLCEYSKKNNDVTSWIFKMPHR